MKDKTDSENEHFVVARSYVARASSNVLLLGSVLTVVSSAALAYPLSAAALVASGLTGAIGIFITALVKRHVTSILNRSQLSVKQDAIIFRRGQGEVRFSFSSVDRVNVYRAKEGGPVERIVISGPDERKTIVGYKDQEVLLARILERTPSHTVSVEYETEDGASRKKWTLLLVLVAIVAASRVLSELNLLWTLAALLVAEVLASIFIILATRSADRTTRRDAALFFLGVVLLSMSTLASLWVLAKFGISL